MELKFTATNIRKAEAEFKMNFFSVFSDFRLAGVNELAFLWRAGGGDDGSFDTAFAAGLDSVMVTILEGVNEAGFLGKKLPKEQLKKMITEAIKEAQKEFTDIIGTSQKSGEKTKASPTK